MITALSPSPQSSWSASRGSPDNRSTEDAVSLALHTALTHLQHPNTYVRILFVDFSSAFNTDSCWLWSSTTWSASLCLWRQQASGGDSTSSPMILNTGTPQGCVLSPALFTHECTAIHSSNMAMKFAGDTTVVGLISDNDETHYREEVQHLTQWCSSKNLILNTSKTKEVIVDYRKSRKTQHAPLCIQGEAVECVLGIYSLYFLWHLLDHFPVVAKYFKPGEKVTTMALLPQEAEAGWTLLSVALYVYV